MAAEGGTAADVHAVLERVPTARIAALIESPFGLEKAFEIATAGPRVVAVALHPWQLATIVECLTPTAVQVAEAEVLLAAVEKAGVSESGVIVPPDGRMVDPAMVGRAREVRSLMREIELRS
ncbi:MAG TPA: hypothetical protein VFI00_16295 [Kribbella sp.]|nr:hypothetical protein [Kribbella sp.]